MTPTPSPAPSPPVDVGALVKRVAMAMAIPGDFPSRDDIREMVEALTTQAAEIEAARLVEYRVCAGCGSSRSMEELKASGHVSCCPERKMLTAKEWAIRAETAEATLTTQAAEIEGLKADNLRLREATSRDNDEICQVLGQALGFPWCLRQAKR